MNRKQNQPLGAAITPNDSRSSPGTHISDFPEPVGGREGEGSPFVLPSGDLFFLLLLIALLLPTGALWGQGGTPVERTAAEQPTAEERRTDPVPPTAPPTTPRVESVRPDEPVDLALETYLRRQEGDSTLFTPRAPGESTMLEESELDSLNPHGKEGDITIPLRGYPAPDDPPRPEKPIYLEGGIGLNTTAQVRAGLSGDSWPFNYHGRFEYFFSNGFIENGEESRIAASLGGGYIIGLDYGIFSGGYMGGDVGYDRRAWRLYALESAPERSSDAWYVEAETGAAIDRLDLKGKGRVRHFSVEQLAAPSEGPTAGNGFDLGMTSIEGELQGKTSTGSILWNGTVDLRLTSAAGSSLAYGMVDLRTGVDFGIFRLRAGGNLGVAEGSDGRSRSLISPVGEVRIAPFDGISLTGRLRGGLHQTTPDRVLDVNRYAALDAAWLPEEESRGYEVILNLVPSTSWGVRGSASRRDFDSRLHFEAPFGGTFTPVYDAVLIDRVDADFFWDVTSRDRVAAIVAFTEGERSDGSPLPYMPRWDAEIFYHRRLFNIPSTAGGSIRYIGERQSGSGTMLDPVMLISLDWSYTVASLFDAVLTARNVLGSSYQIWEGYQERGFFLSVGVRARL